MSPPEFISTEPCLVHAIEPESSETKYAQHAAFTLPPLNDDLREILGRPNFACGQVAAVLRLSGMEIAHKAEAEQAAVIHWMLNQYGAHGADWWLHCRDELQATVDAHKAPRSKA